MIYWNFSNKKLQQTCSFISLSCHLETSESIIKNLTSSGEKKENQRQQQLNYFSYFAKWPKQKCYITRFSLHMIFYLMVTNLNLKNTNLPTNNYSINVNNKTKEENHKQWDFRVLNCQMTRIPNCRSHF